MKECWKEVKISSVYKVSNTGRIKKNGQLIKQNLSTSGYPRVSISKNGWNKTVSVHRLVAKAFIPNPKGKLFVNHKNGIKDDNRVENLEWVTRGENEAHAHKIGLKSTVGEKNGNSKLSKSDVLYVKKMLKNKVSIYKLADEFDVSSTCISLIKRGERWNHVKLKQ